MSAFAQSTLTGDLDLSTGNLVLVKDPATLCAAKLTNVLQFFLGEWFMDTRQGVPYFQNVFVKNPDLGSIGQLFAKIILQTPGVKALQSANLDFDNTGRTLSANFTVQTDTGAVLQGGLGTPFVVILGTTGSL